MKALWVFVPLIGAALAHAPVLRFGLLRGLAKPIDGGATIRGRRIFGDNKTWRGAVVMTAGIFTLTCVLSRVPSYWSRLPAEIQAAGAPIFGLLLGLGTVLGELPNSFIKRQLDIAPGSQRRSLIGAFFIVIDQGDFVFGVWLLLLPIWVMPPLSAVAAFAAVVVVHLAVNVIGYSLGVRLTPL